MAVSPMEDSEPRAIPAVADAGGQTVTLPQFTDYAVADIRFTKEKWELVILVLTPGETVFSAERWQGRIDQYTSTLPRIVSG